MSTIAGQGSFRIAKATIIENAVTGDGNDLLSGNARDNRLLGMRGDDWLVGGGGRDRLDGGAGLDTADYSGSRAAVSIDLQSGRGSGGDARGDRLSGIEALVGSRFGDQLVGNAFENRLDGRGGNDVLAGGAGADTFAFSTPGFGHDTVLDFEDGVDRLDFSALHLEASVIGITASALGAVVTTPHGLVELRGIGAPSITLDDFVL
jgi:Ca2+-binding RTX toxin-like protein